MGIYLYLIIITVDTKGSRMWVVISRWNEKIMTITTCNGCNYYVGQNIFAIRINTVQWTKYSKDKYDNINMQ